jgi:porin
MRVRSNEIRRWRIAVRLALLATTVMLCSPLAPTPANAETADAATTGEAKPTTKKPVKEQLEEVWNRDLITGDWQGWRTTLHDRGIDLGLRLSQYGQGVASGGVDKKVKYGGTMDYRLNVDLEKSFGLWEGFMFTMHARSRWGDDVNAEAGALTLPNAGLLQPLPGGYDDTNVTGLMIMQSFFDSRAAAFFGKLDVIDLVDGFFPEIGFGQESFWNVNALVSAMPWFGPIQGLSLWGGGVWTVNEGGIINSGFIVTGTENALDVDNFSDSFSDGVAMFGFVRPTWKLAEMPGYFLAFAGGSTKKQLANDSLPFIEIPGNPGSVIITSGDPDKKRPWGVALYLSQVFWQAENDANRKAAITVGYSFGPNDVQFSSWNVFTRVELFGPLASRPNDRMGVAGWGNGITSDYKERVRDLTLGTRELRDLWGFEVYYNIEINRWLHLAPDLQVLRNENKGDDTAIVPGIRLVMDF